MGRLAAGRPLPRISGLGIAAAAVRPVAAAGRSAAAAGRALLHEDESRVLARRHVGLDHRDIRDGVGERLAVSARRECVLAARETDAGDAVVEVPDCGLRQHWGALDARFRRLELGRLGLDHDRRRLERRLVHLGRSRNDGVAEIPLFGEEADLEDLQA